MKLAFQPGCPLNGETSLPGDKSLSHRAALFAALAKGPSRIEHFLVSGVTRVMLDALQKLGVHWELERDTLRMDGEGLHGWKTSSATLDCGNSATTLRLLAGAIAASGSGATLTGSQGLRRRPMERIVEPLQKMGVEILTSDSGNAPLTLLPRWRGSYLRASHYSLPVASAQVKSCLLLAALGAEGASTFVEPSLSRDHSERMLAGMGVAIKSEVSMDGVHSVQITPPSGGVLNPLQITLSGDTSAASFLIAAACSIPESCITLHEVLLNPTRTGLLEVLRRMGANIEQTRLHDLYGEPVGDLTITYSPLVGTDVQGSQVVDMIDEFPAFAVAAACARGQSRVCQAGELRHKESDRISALCLELLRAGVSVEETSDGFTIEGKGFIPGGCTAFAHGDHRLGMAMAVAGMAAQKPISVDGAEMSGESFPGFGETFQCLGARLIPVETV